MSCFSGFAILVLNVRGSTGHGRKYMKSVDHDWYGDNRLDPIAAIKMLENDSRILARPPPFFLMQTS
ncbi:MAG: prolyl oligopeptidase family serine peptidase [Candidatus Thorarchaeota archaeon]